MLGLIILPRLKLAETPMFNWHAVVSLFAYMIFFSFANLSLAAGTGALILFGAVQLTMFLVALKSGEHFSGLSWAGLGLAIGGLVYLVSPGVTAPDPLGAAMMAVAGIAWGWYSLLGRSSVDPLASTAWNFIYSVPLAAVASLLFLKDFHITASGALLAAATLGLANLAQATESDQPEPEEWLSEITVPVS